MKYILFLALFSLFRLSSSEDVIRALFFHEARSILIKTAIPFALSLGARGLFFFAKKENTIKKIFSHTKFIGLLSLLFSAGWSIKKNWSFLRSQNVEDYYDQELLQSIIPKKRTVTFGKITTAYDKTRLEEYKQATIDTYNDNYEKVFDKIENADFSLLDLTSPDITYFIFYAALLENFLKNTCQAANYRTAIYKVVIFFTNLFNNLDHKNTQKLFKILSFINPDKLKGGFSIYSEKGNSERLKNFLFEMSKTYPEETELITPKAADKVPPF